MTDDPRIATALTTSLERGEVGVQVAAYLDGELIVDQWTGLADRATGRGVDGSTIFPSFSVAKGVTATALHLQAERGLLDYGDRIADHWPEFAAHGKGDATITDALSHRAGVPQLPPGLTVEQLTDWNTMAEVVAAQPPLTPPGTTNAYHPMSFGWIIGELVRRTDPAGRSFRDFVADEVVAPLALDSLFLGVPDDDLGRVAVLESQIPPPATPRLAALREQTVPRAAAIGPETYNSRAFLQACLPATGLTTNARSISRLFSLLAGRGALGSIRLLSEERVRSFAEPRPDYRSDDATNLRFMPVGTRGFWLADPTAGGSPSLICSVGRGGAVAWADLETGLAAAVCHNRMFDGAAVGPHPLAPIGEAIRAVAADRR